MYTKGTNKVTSKTGIISITPPFLEKERLFLTILNKEFSAIEKDIPYLTFIESFCEFFKVFKNKRKQIFVFAEYSGFDCFNSH